MKTILLLLILLQTTSPLFAQQSPRTLFSPLNWQLMNPGALDRWMFDKAPQPSCMVTGGILLDGVGGKNSPMTFFLSSEAMATANFHWGGDVYYDKTDAISTFDGSLMAKYIGRFDRSGLVWSFGIQPRLFCYNVRVSRLQFAQANDPALENYHKNAINFEAGCGFFLRQATHWYAGISTLSLVALTRRKGGLIRAPERTPQINIILGYNQPYENSIVEYRGGINVVKNLQFYTLAPRLPVSANLNVRLHLLSDKRLANEFWFGTGLGTNGLLSVDVGWENLEKPVNSHPVIPKLRIGISFSLPVWDRTVLFDNDPAGVEVTFACPFSPPGSRR